MGSPKPRVRQYRAVSRAVIRAFVALFITAWLLAGAGFFVSVHALQGEITGRATIAQLCVTGNEFRAQQVQLWEHIIRVSVPPPRETPARQRQRQAAVRQFRAYMRQVFAPRNC